MSVKLEIYQDIKAKLQTLTFIKNVLHYNGQDLNNFEKEQAVRFPQAWIQLNSITWQPSSQQMYNQNQTHEQKSEIVTITVYYASEINLKNDDDTFEDHLVSIDLIYRALTMMDSDNYSPLQRVSESDTPTNNNVRIWAQEFTTMLTECAIAEDKTDAAPVELTINKNIL